MKAFSKNSDSIFLGLVILALAIGAGVLYSQWQVIEHYWKTDFRQHSASFDPNQVISMPAGRDTMIQPIDVPLFAPVAIVERHFSAIDPVIVVDSYGVSRAYPLQILATHEIVNDQIADIPIAVTFCPLCNSAIVYRRETDGHILRMGVSGNFYGNNFLMYDDRTESWWHQLTGEALVGEYAGQFLEIVPSQVVAFATYSMRYPAGEVLVGDAQNTNISYQLSTLIHYQRSRAPLLSNGDYDERLQAMERVLATTIADVPIAYSFDTLQEMGVVNDVVEDYEMVVFWMPTPADPNNIDPNLPDYGQASAFGRVVGGQTLTFRSDEGRIFDNETNSEWNIFGEAIAGELIGAKLPDLQCFTHFWFAWSSTYPETLVYDG
ncbi:MAG: DUF3179 domain-containing protein [Chloroflexota bacterium]